MAINSTVSGIVENTDLDQLNIRRNSDGTLTAQVAYKIASMDRIVIRHASRTLSQFEIISVGALYWAAA